MGNVYQCPKCGNEQHHEDKHFGSGRDCIGKGCEYHLTSKDKK